MSDSKSLARKGARLRLGAAMAANPDDVHHGTIYGYKAGSCRCTRCCRAWRLYTAGAPYRRKASSKERLLAWLAENPERLLLPRRQMSAALGIAPSTCSTALSTLRREGKLVPMEKQISPCLERL